MTEKLKTSVETVFNGQTITINKLRAGKYYEAQEIYLGMIDSLRKQMVQKPQVGKDNKPLETDKAKSGEISSKLPLDVSTLYSVFPKEIVKLVSFCIEVEADKLLAEAYPEEISDMAEKVISLNNFSENLKNSVAPLGSLGATKKD